MSLGAIKYQLIVHVSCNTDMSQTVLWVFHTYLILDSWKEGRSVVKKFRPRAERFPPFFFFSIYRSSSFFFIMASIKQANNPFYQSYVGVCMVPQKNIFWEILKFYPWMLLLLLKQNDLGPSLSVFHKTSWIWHDIELRKRCLKFFALNLRFGLLSNDLPRRCILGYVNDFWF